MAGSLTMRVGQGKQLRVAAVGDVESWASSRPGVVSVTDEDIRTGRRGGAVTAMAPGRSRVTARGFGGEELLCVDITVESAPAVTVEAGSTAATGLAAGTRWTSSHPQVAEPEAAGADRVRGVSPGVALLRSDGRPPMELQVRVTGAVPVETGRTVSLADRFAVPVSGWRTLSPNAATIDARGAVTAGDRPLTAVIVATLPGGEEFQINVRISRPSGAGPAPQSEIPRAASAAPDVARRITDAAPPQPLGRDDAGDAGARQAGDVRRHLAEAEALVAAGNLTAADATLRAAETAALTEEELREQVRRARDGLRQAVREANATACAAAAAALRGGNLGQAQRQVRALSLPPPYRGVADALRTVLESLQAFPAAAEVDEPGVAPLRQALRSAFDASLRDSMYEVLPELMAVAAKWDVGELAPVAVAALAGRALEAAPRSVRPSLAARLREMGTPAVEAALAALASPAPPDPGGLLDVLPEMKLGDSASVVIKFFAGRPPGAQALMAERLCRLAEPSFGALADLLAGVLKKMPPDPRLPKAVRDLLGAANLEEKAKRWAAGGHAGSRLVLQRLYGYPDSVFPR